MKRVVPIIYKAASLVVAIIGGVVIGTEDDTITIIIGMVFLWVGSVIHTLIKDPTP